MKSKRIKKKDSKVCRESIVKFVDLMISDDYKNAHKELEVVVQEKVKAKIKDAIEEQDPFKSKMEKKLKGKSSKK